MTVIESPWKTGSSKTSHTFSSLSPGTYKVSARVKDTSGLISNWSDPTNALVGYSPNAEAQYVVDLGIEIPINTIRELYVPGDLAFTPEAYNLSMGEQINIFKNKTWNITGGLLPQATSHLNAFSTGGEYRYFKLALRSKTGRRLINSTGCTYELERLNGSTWHRLVSPLLTINVGIGLSYDVIFNLLNKERNVRYRVRAYLPESKVTTPWSYYQTSKYFPGDTIKIETLEFCFVPPTPDIGIKHNGLFYAQTPKYMFIPVQTMMAAYKFIPPLTGNFTSHLSLIDGVANTNVIKAATSGHLARLKTELNSLVYSQAIKDRLFIPSAIEAANILKHRNNILNSVGSNFYSLFDGSDSFITSTFASYTGLPRHLITNTGTPRFQGTQTSNVKTLYALSESFASLNEELISLSPTWETSF